MVPEKFVDNLEQLTITSYTVSAYLIPQEPSIKSTANMVIKEFKNEKWFLGFKHITSRTAKLVTFPTGFLTYLHRCLISFRTFLNYFLRRGRTLTLILSITYPNLVT